MKKNSLEPNKVAFVITDKCTADCDICCFECSPQKEQYLSTEFMKLVIDKVAETVNLLLLKEG